MIVSFYDKDFNGLSDNASLVIDDSSYKLIKRGVDFDSLSCVCEAYAETIQPAFVVVRSELGRYMYGALAGIPEVTSENKTKITATDLKCMLNSELLLDFGTYTNVDEVLDYVLDAWLAQVNQSTLTVDYEYTAAVGTIALTDLQPVPGKAKYNAWDVIKHYLKYYDLYMTGAVDLINKKVMFTIGKALYTPVNLKLWEYGIRGYGKWVASVNETQGYVNYAGAWTTGTKWILTSGNAVTTNAALRDIYPVKRKVVVKDTDDADKVAELLVEANTEALELLTDGLFNEDIEIVPQGIAPGLDAKFKVYAERGAGLYKDLPCGELHYDASGLVKVQVGYRFKGLRFVL